MCQRDSSLMDIGDEWKSEETLQDNHLIKNAVVIMKFDWKDTSFPREISDDSPLSEDDRLTLDKELAAKMDGVEFLHQTGILFHYLKYSPSLLIAVVLCTEF